MATGDGAARFFDINAHATSVVYVIDRSVSMGPSGGLVRAKQEVIASLRRMPDQTLFQIILFNRSVEMIPPGSTTGLLPATNENKRKAADFLKSIEPEGGTQPVPALKRALALKPQVIFFLSDGGDWTDRQVQEVTTINRGHTVIHVVDLEGSGRDQAKGPLQILASRNQGEYRAVLMSAQDQWKIQGN
jgi:Ca-activated chloride channel family protein